MSSARKVCVNSFDGFKDGQDLRITVGNELLWKGPRHVFPHSFLWQCWNHDVDMIDFPGGLGVGTLRRALTLMRGGRAELEVEEINDVLTFLDFMCVEHEVWRSLEVSSCSVPTRIVLDALAENGKFSLVRLMAMERDRLYTGHSMRSIAIPFFEARWLLQERELWAVENDLECIWKPSIPPLSFVEPPCFQDVFPWFPTTFQWALSSGEVALALKGGAAAHLLHGQGFGDLDFFLYTQNGNFDSYDQLEAKKLVGRAIVELSKNASYSLLVQNTSVTTLLLEFGSTKFQVQFFLHVFPSISDILVSSDIDVTSVLYCGASQHFGLHMSPIALMAYASGFITIRSPFDSSNFNSLQRILRYKSRGFGIRISKNVLETVDVQCFQASPVPQDNSEEVECRNDRQGEDKEAEKQASQQEDESEGISEQTVVNEDSLALPSPLDSDSEEEQEEQEVDSDDDCDDADCNQDGEDDPFEYESNEDLFALPLSLDSDNEEEEEVNSHGGDDDEDNSAEDNNDDDGNDRDEDNNDDDEDISDDGDGYGDSEEESFGADYEDGPSSLSVVAIARLWKQGGLAKLNGMTLCSNECCQGCERSDIISAPYLIESAKGEYHDAFVYSRSEHLHHFKFATQMDRFLQKCDKCSLPPQRSWPWTQGQSEAPDVPALESDAVIMEVLHEEPPTQILESEAAAISDQQWVQFQEMNLGARSSDGTRDSAEAHSARLTPFQFQPSQRIVLMKFTRTPVECQNVLFDGPELQPCREAMTQSGFAYELLSKAKVFVHPHEYPSVMRWIGCQEFDLRVCHVVASEDIKPLVEQAIRSIPSRQNVRIRCTEAIMQPPEIRVVNTFIDVRPGVLLETMTQLTQSTTDAHGFPNPRRQDIHHSV